MKTYQTAREDNRTPESHLKVIFGDLMSGPSDALFSDNRRTLSAGICGLPYKAPFMAELLTHPSASEYLNHIFARNENLLIRVMPDQQTTFHTEKEGTVSPLDPPPNFIRLVSGILTEIPNWGGIIDQDGSHIIDLKTPLPGPHYAVNLLLGNRIGFSHPLQTTPKSVVDRLGRGSFRSHAATQVLATRWDLRQEENGFPCNRQFYLTEGAEQIFYSADPEEANVTSGSCRHGRNHTEIRYRTFCGLEIVRTIFLMPQEEGLPLATEIQRVELTNNGSTPRKLRLVQTGMFGPSKPPALQEDVLYSTIIMEGGILSNSDGSVLAVSPRYQPLQDRDDRRFSVMMLRDSRGLRYPAEYSLDYTGFIGKGTLEKPAGLMRLPCKLTRKGPGFFALAGELLLNPGETVTADLLTGLVSRKSMQTWNEETLETEISRLVTRLADKSSVTGILEQVLSFQKDYASFLKIDTGDAGFSRYVSENLPFQVLYQTFVSRAFAWTQKGYRETGFREIQDIYASLYYLNAGGHRELARTLILDWAAQVFEFGYANHNFFWTGKEAGRWSDDALWLHQAVGRYVRLTGDLTILTEKISTADTPQADGKQKVRPLMETLAAALRYSTEVSVGRHGLPLLDLADWNDCLKIDTVFHSGPEKEKIFKETGRYSSDGTESVMNGFLAVTAAGELEQLARLAGDKTIEGWAREKGKDMRENLRKHAWIGENYARLLLNRYPGFTHAGAAGDHLDTDGSEGTLFLNSFSWSILSGTASESQIAAMLPLVRKKLKTPFGLKLVSPSDLGRITNLAATAEYFPGDRENGAVFKHAAMMAVAAFFDAAKQVSDSSLARELAEEGWTMLHLAYPGRSMSDPFVLAGNPRFCTQYNNSETGENIGPLLSGTATWMILSLMKGYGIGFDSGELVLEPVLRPEETEVRLSVRTGGKHLDITILKPEGFRRPADGGFSVTVNGKKLSSTRISMDGPEENLKIVGEFLN